MITATEIQQLIALPPPEPKPKPVPSGRPRSARVLEIEAAMERLLVPFELADAVLVAGCERSAVRSVMSEMARRGELEVVERPGGNKPCKWWWTA